MGKEPVRVQACKIGEAIGTSQASALEAIAEDIELNPESYEAVKAAARRIQLRNRRRQGNRTPRHEAA